MTGVHGTPLVVSANGPAAAVTCGSRVVAASWAGLALGAPRTVAFDADSSWLGFAVIAGRWYAGPGEMDVSTSFLNQSGLHVGDSATLSTGARQVSVRIAGQVYRPGNEPTIFTSTQTLGGITAGLQPEQLDIQLRPATNTGAWINAVNKALGARPLWYATASGQDAQFYAIAGDLVALLALMVAAAAALGVFNTILMGIRDRLHDLVLPLSSS